MKKIISLILSFLFLHFAISQENTLLWEITKKGHKKSYLFGSIHSNHDSVLALGDKVLPYLESCQAYAGEIIIQPEDMFAMLPYFLEKDTTKQCGKLLSHEEMEKVKAAVQEVVGPEINIFVPFMSPYIVASLIANPNETSTHFLDIYLQEKADDIELELISLESVKSQMAYIQKIDGEEQKKHLLDLLEHLDEAETEIDDMILMYLAQDLGEIQKLLDSASSEDPLFTEGFMEDRNALQAKGIMEAMKSSKVFVAVGAAHLPGENGVIQLLIDAGFSLEPIFNF